MNVEPPAWKEWLIKADADLCAARLLIDSDAGLAEIIGFHCQQAAEKMLKAFLALHEQLIPRTHDLRSLARDCSELDPDFGSWIPRLAALTPFSVRFRYPDSPAATRHDVREALDLVLSLQQFLAARWPDPKA